MRRPSSHTRYDILTSAEAWSLIGTLDADEFAAVQAEIEKLAWSAFTMRGSQAGPTTHSVTAATVGMLCEVDHVSRRVTVLSLTRGAGRNVLRAAEPLQELPESSERRSGSGTGK